MKKLYIIILAALIFFTVLINYSCDPFDDIYLTLALKLEFNTSGILADVLIPAEICLDDFDSYNDNNKNIEEITYLSSIYFTKNSTEGLTGDSLKLVLYQSDRSTILFEYFQLRFNADDYKENPLELILNDQQKTNLNEYLKNPQINKCFYATFELKNIDYNSPAQNYFLESKMEFLTHLKIKP